MRGSDGVSYEAGRKARVAAMLSAAYAVVSDGGLYRYELHRGGRPGEPQRRLPRRRWLMWLMLNPSTADARFDDPTVRRCAGFAVDWGFAGFSVGNLFAFRSVWPGELLGAEDPVGPANDHYIRRMAARADRIVLAWGGGGAAMGAARRCEVLNRLEREWPEKLRVLGWTAGGEPRHPLMMRADATMQEYGGAT